MKKIAILMMLISFGTKGIAQEGNNPNESKKFRFGLHIDPTLSWYSPVDKKKFENNGMKMKMSIGAVADIKLAENIWLSTGASFSFLGGSLAYLDSVGYYEKGEEIVPFENITTDSTFLATNNFMLLKSRSFNARYLTIPLLLKMKTKEIGYLTYFGQFGLNAHIKMGAAKADDEVTNLSASSPTNASLEDMLITKEPSFLALAANVGFGAEYNISGSTSLYGSLGFNYGLNSAVSKKSDHLVDVEKSNASSPFSYIRYEEHKSPMHGLVLTIGVLF
jgi:hypothetical protein